MSDKLDRGDKTAFNQLVYALVRTKQLDCARMLDEEMTEIYRQENDGKNGYLHLYIHIHKFKTRANIQSLNIILCTYEQ